MPARNLAHRQILGNNGRMPTAVIVDAVRTPVGRRGGRLSGWHPVDLAAQPLLALVERNDLDPALVEDVIMGCTMTVGEQAMNIARNAALAAGFPDTVPGTTVDRQCGSAQQAVHFAAQAVMAGAMDVVIGGGVESMSRVPIGATTEPGPGEAYGPMYRQRYELIHQGECAEEIARRWKVSRVDMDVLALESHRRAALAIDEGRFKNEIIPIETRYADWVVPKEGQALPEGLLDFDEGVRRDTTLEKLASLQAGLPPGRHGHRRDLVADLRRGGGGAGDERGAGGWARAAGPGPVPHLRRGGQRPADHADRPHPGHPAACSRRPSSRSTTSTWWRSTRRSPRWCWPGSARSTPTCTGSIPTAAPSPSATPPAARAPA